MHHGKRPRQRGAKRLRKFDHGWVQVAGIGIQHTHLRLARHHYGGVLVPHVRHVIHRI